ncbi:hypothetical protein PVAG01_01444 [Phlyctema vagabunda]|uniref:Uncharacterized protein n=1 Tax=Phlyctema vagabunda TaxID=108571 RepID=A0ABR4PX45_9HELO
MRWATLPVYAAPNHSDAMGISSLRHQIMAIASLKTSRTIITHVPCAWKTSRWMTVCGIVVHASKYAIGNAHKHF